MDGPTLNTPTPDPDNPTATRGRALVPAEVRSALKQGGSTIGKFITVRELGQGGMGVVYQGWDPDLGRWVALKVIKGAGEPHEIARFLREAQTSAQLVHPNIAQVYEAAEQPLPYLAIQYIDGVSANSYDPRRLPLTRAAEIVRDAAIGLDFAHSKGVIHRDVKPHNLMVGKDGQVYVLDFGLAKSLHSDSSLSISGAIVGTPNFMSPEQAQAKRDLGRATDIYSLGATLYWLTTGKAPSAGRSLQETLHNVVEVDPPKPSSHQPRIPADLDAIVLKTMEKDPRRRYPTARALADDLQRFLLGEPVTAHVPSLGVRLSRWTRKNKGLAAGLAGVAALAVALVAVLVVSARQDLRRVEELRQKELTAEATKRQAQDALAVIESIGRRIVEWAAVLHDPPRDMTAEDARLESMVAELDRAPAPDVLCRASALAHKGTAYVLMDRPDAAVKHLEESLALFREFAAAAQAPFREEGRFQLLLGTQYLRDATKLKIKADAYGDAGEIQIRTWRHQSGKAMERARECLDAAIRAGLGEDSDYARALAGLADDSLNRGNLEALLDDAARRASARPDARWLEVASEAAARLGREEDPARYAVAAALILESSVYHVRRAAERTLPTIRDTNVPGAANPERIWESERWLRQALALRPDDAESALLYGGLADRLYWYVVRGKPDATEEDRARSRRMLKETGDLCARHVDALAAQGFAGFMYRLSNNAIHLGMMQLAAGENPNEALDQAIRLRAEYRKLQSQSGAEDSETAWAHTWKIKYLRLTGSRDGAAVLREARGAEASSPPGARGPDGSFAVASCWWEAAGALNDAGLDTTEAAAKAEEWATISLMLKEDFLDPWVLRGQIRLAVGNRTGALQDFMTASRLAPDREDLRRVVESLR